MRPETWIALDGGTTNTRASLVREGRIETTVKAAAGVRDTQGASINPVKEAVVSCVTQLLERHCDSSDTVRIVASGMLGSEAGLTNVRHVAAPATAADLARGSVVWTDQRLAGFPLRILPGVITGRSPDASLSWESSMSMDIMRGEETQVWGIRERLEKTAPEIVTRPWLLLWPGSHTKLIAVEADGTILGSYTTLAGETYAALKSGTLLSRSVSETPVDRIDDTILETAAHEVRKHGLLRAAFWTRIADVTGSLDQSGRSAWLSAIVTAEDVETLLRHKWLSEERFGTLLVGGEGGRQKAYVKLTTARIGERAKALDNAISDEAAALGAVRLGKIAEAG